MNPSPAEQPLLDVFLIHHKEDDADTAKVRLDALQPVFAPDPETRRSAYSQTLDPWTRVHFERITDPAMLTERLRSAAKRAIFIIMVTEKLADANEWQQPLTTIAASISQKSVTTQWNALVYATSEEALKKLPPGINVLQAREAAHIHVESAFRPHILALLALHRARLVLGARPAENILKLFISHAKSDGLFLALSLRTLIEGVPEMKKWYDAADIQSGDEWKESIAKAAGSSIFIAVRTDIYDQREWCCREFQAALTAGVPIVVVDALLGTAIRASSLPFSAMPTVRIPDGNIHRVLTAALREHLRLLLLETLVQEKAAAALPGDNWRVWPRLPALASYDNISAGTDPPLLWLVADPPQEEREFLELQARLDHALKLRLEILSNFLTAQTFAAPTV